MKEHQLKEALNDLYGEVPLSTHNAFMAARIPTEKEGRAMKKKMLMTPVFALLIALMLGTVAFAAAGQVLDWYYAERFSTYPAEQRDAILDNVQSVPAQEQDENADFFATVQEYSWVAAEKKLVLTLNVKAVNHGIELHPMWNLDADGALGDEGREEHWLWTAKGFGKPEDVMADPSKALYLTDMQDMLRIGSHEDNFTATLEGSTDAVVMPDGSVQFVLEYHFASVDEARSAERADYITDPERLQECQAQDAQVREAILKGGEMSLCLPYYTIAYADVDVQPYGSRRVMHWVDFTIDLGNIPADFFK